MNGDNTGGPNDDGRLGVRNYMSDAEAKSFHRMFIVSAAAFTFIAVLAHFFLWQWRPWGGASMTYQQQQAITAPATTSMNTAAPATTQHS